MGIRYEFNCEKCGCTDKVVLGKGGYWYAKIYPQVISAAIDGEFGAEIQKIFKDHPNSAVAYSKVLIQCKNCGRHENILALSVYLPKDEGFVNEKKCLNFLDIKKHYKCVAEFEPKCKFCGGNVEIFTEDTFDAEELTLNCPNCRSLMTGDFVGTWD